MSNTKKETAVNDFLNIDDTKKVKKIKSKGELIERVNKTYVTDDGRQLLLENK